MDLKCSHNLSKKNKMVEVYLIINCYVQQNVIPVVEKKHKMKSFFMIDYIRCIKINVLFYYITESSL